MSFIGARYWVQRFETDYFFATSLCVQVVLAERGVLLHIVFASANMQAWHLIQEDLYCWLGMQSSWPRS